MACLNNKELKVERAPPSTASEVCLNNKELKDISGTAF